LEPKPVFYMSRRACVHLPYVFFRGHPISPYGSGDLEQIPAILSAPLVECARNDTPLAKLQKAVRSVAVAARAECQYYVKMASRGALPVETLETRPETWGHQPQFKRLCPFFIFKETEYSTF
jgi:hypothetical protein